MKAAHNRGFTLVELLVVIAIIGVMVAMTIPAVQASREVARRSLCASRIGQLLIAMQSYEDALDSLPSGVLNPDGPIRSEPSGYHESWIVQLLPYMDEGNLYRQIDLTKSMYDPANAAVRGVTLEVLLCPSNPDEQVGTSDYAGCHNDVEAPIAADNAGVLFLNSRIRREEIPDGASHTIFLSEKLLELNDLGWMSGTRATLRNTGLPLGHSSPPAPEVTYVGGFASGHTAGSNVGLGDGSVKFFSDTIDLEVWHQLGNRGDGKIVNLPPAE